MHQFQKSRVVLLEELHKLVTTYLSEEHEFVTHDIRKYNRKLKAMRKEIQEWQEDLIVQETLQKAEAKRAEAERKRSEEFYASDPSNRDQ